jgi:hypothetical protein
MLPRGESAVNLRAGESVGQLCGAREIFGGAIVSEEAVTC